MTKSKFICRGLIVLFLVIIIVWIIVKVRKVSVCPNDTFSSAAVATDSENCSAIGRDMLLKGGSAVDAAIAALLCTSVINPQSMGIGGGSIFTVMDSSGKVTIINSRETVPETFKPDLLKTCSWDNSGSQWIGVPGEIRGYEEAHRRYGKLPWETLFQPTIKLAREGFPIPKVLGRRIAAMFNGTDKTGTNGSLRKLFSHENGTLLKTGDIMKFEKLADTLEMIAKNGTDVFYTGRIAEDLIHDIQEAGGTITARDLAAYKVTVTEAWVVPFGEYQMYIPPPPAGGAILSLILNIMKGYNLNSASLKGEEKNLTYHRYVEALKFAEGLRKYIRDPHFSSEKDSQLAKNITMDSFAEDIRRRITNETHNATYYNITYYWDSMGTSHVSVLPEDGSAVSVTSSINYIFGSKIFSNRTGIILNNQLSDFCGKATKISSGEQPPSSMAPVVLKSKRNTLVIGGSGGKMITTGIASALMNHLWFGMNIEEAITAPVVFYNSTTHAVNFEPKFDEDVIEGLKALGHKNKSAEYFHNVVNAVEKEDSCISAWSDTRKDGKAAGY